MRDKAIAWAIRLFVIFSLVVLVVPLFVPREDNVIFETVEGIYYMMFVGE